MAHKTNTVIKLMLSESDKTLADVNAYLGKDDTYLESILSGRSHLSPTGLSGIAHACGFELSVSNGRVSYDIADAVLPDKSHDFDTTGEIHDCEFSGKHIAFTGDFFGLSESAQEKICIELGATWESKMRKGKCDMLVVGDLSRYNGTSRQKADAERWGKWIMPSDEFRNRVEEIIGRPMF